MDQMKDFGVLKFIDRFEKLFENAGINYPVMRRLLQLMLIMDRRRSTTVMVNRAEKNENTYSSLFKGYLFSYGLLGVFIVILMLVPFSLFVKMSIILGMIIIMVMTTMVSDFSSVLLDLKDRSILVPKPIDFRTLNMAKSLHTFIYMGMITFFIAGPSLAAGTIKYGLSFFIIFFVQLIFMDLLVIFFASILYYAVLQFFDGDKLRDFISYFQILLSIAMILIYEVVGKSLDMFNINVSFAPRWWTYILPSVWFAGPYSIFIEKVRGSVYIILSLLSIIVPAALFLAYYFWVNPYIERNLLKLSFISEKRARFIESKEIFKSKLYRIVSWDRKESIFFRFTQNMVSGERQLKLKLHPSLAYAIVFPLIFLFTSFSRSTSFFSVYWGLSNSPFYLSIYITLVILSNLYVFVYTSEKYKGAWLYNVLPLNNPSTIFKGSIKSFIVRYLAPIYIFTGLIFYMFYGAALLPHLIVMFINLVILVIINFDIRSKRLPFSLEFLEPKANRGCRVLIVSITYCVINAVIEYFVPRFIPYGLEIYIIVMLLSMIILWRNSFKLKWNDLR